MDFVKKNELPKIPPASFNDRILTQLFIEWDIHTYIQDTNKNQN